MPVNVIIPDLLSCFCGYASCQNRAQSSIEVTIEQNKMSYMRFLPEKHLLRGVDERVVVEAFDPPSVPKKNMGYSQPAL